MRQEKNQQHHHIPNHNYNKANGQLVLNQNLQTVIPNNRILRGISRNKQVQAHLLQRQ